MLFNSMLFNSMLFNSTLFNSALFQQRAALVIQRLGFSTTSSMRLSCTDQRLPNYRLPDGLPVLSPAVYSLSGLSLGAEGAAAGGALAAGCGVPGAFGPFTSQYTSNWPCAWLSRLAVNALLMPFL